MLQVIKMQMLCIYALQIDVLLLTVVLVSVL